VDIVVLAIIVTMGIMGGGMVALTLMAPRRNQTIFGLLVLFALVLGLAAVVVAALSSLTRAPASSWWLLIVEYIGNLLLASILGYAVTTFFVLNRPGAREPELPDRQASAAAAGNGPDKTAVLYFVPGEPPDYNLSVIAPGLEIQDYHAGLPPALLRPFYLHTLREKYTRIGHNPTREQHLRLAQKVQDRLARRARVYICFYNDQPGLAEAAAMAIRDGARRLVVLHARLTDPPPQARVPDLIASIRPERYGVTVVETAPLWDSELLTRLWVRRAQAAVPAERRPQAGLLLVGHGHPMPGRAAPAGARPAEILRRQNQEMSFQKRVRQALIRGGFDEDKVVIGWLHWQEPRLPGALSQLLAERGFPIYWLGTGFAVDGVATLHDIPLLLRQATPPGVAPAQSLGAWADDDLVAEALVERAKEAMSG
jgi:protoheme ferro-lyase